MGCSTTPAESKPFLLQAAHLQKISNWLSIHYGEVRLLYFWVSYHRNCVPDLLVLNQVQTLFPSNQFSLLTINLDPNGIINLKTLIEKYPLKFPVLIGGEDICSIYHITALPKLVLLNPQNQCVFEADGSISLEILKQQIQSYLPSK